MKYKIIEEFIGEDPRDFYISVQADEHPFPIKIWEVKATLLRRGIVSVDDVPCWRERLTVELEGMTLKSCSDDPKLYALYRDFCLRHGKMLNGDGKFLGDP